MSPPVRLRQAEWLKTAKSDPTRHAVGTAVRLPNGVESDGQLKAGQLAVFITEDGPTACAPPTGWSTATGSSCAPSSRRRAAW
jgi:hypothetical protein